MELQWCDLPIFVLRMHVDGNEKMLTSETFPILSYDHQDELDELKKMADSDAKTIKDMYYYACENDIKELLDLKEEAYLKMEKSPSMKEWLAIQFMKDIEKLLMNLERISQL